MMIDGQKNLRAMNGSTKNNDRRIMSKPAMYNFALMALVVIGIYIRLKFATPPFSFDYKTYISIIETVRITTFSELLNETLVFPYTTVTGMVPIELGFSFLVKVVSLPGIAPETIFALIASASVGLRIYVMRAVGMPLVWILWLNVIIITLLEANALRLGVATSILLLGLHRFSISRNISGFIYIFIAILMHLQVTIFVLPFIIVFIISKWIYKSNLRLIATIIGASSFTAFSVQFIPLLANEKIQEYASLGGSGSSGITFTSIFAVLMLGSAAFTIKQEGFSVKDARFFAAIVAGCAPSVVMLIVLTDISVVGDRAWQLAFVVFSTFFFSNWAHDRLKKVSRLLLIFITMIMLINVTVRYPLSNFFSPPFPEVYYKR